MEYSMPELQAPFPWFGGKSRASDLVWSRFGSVARYVEPFAGSLAVLLGRPHEPKYEIVNDTDCHLVNFWRAVQADPDGVAHHCDWPVNEADLHARHLWLVTTGKERVGRLRTDPDYYDSKIAGWWCWGLCAWIGSGWCVGGRPSQQRPHLSHVGGVHRQVDVLQWFGYLSTRLRRVKVCCGDWGRVVTDGVILADSGVCGILLDPPYADTAGRDAKLYAAESLTVAHDVRRWAIAAGHHPRLRIAVCGYEGEHAMPDDWECVEWKAHGGYGNQGAENVNKHRERIWFSPHCLRGDSIAWDIVSGKPTICDQISETGDAHEG